MSIKELDISQKPLNGKTALIIGASRGIGKQIALTFAEAGCKVCISAKTTEQKSSLLEGTIYDVEKEIKQRYGQDRAMAIPCDVRNEVQIKELIQKVVSACGRIDIMCYVPGAIWWNTIENTPLKRFDLMHSVNMRGAYSAVTEVLPVMHKQGYGHIVLCSPPIYSRFFKGKGAYAITKVGMTILTHTLGQELKGKGIAVNTFWPATAVKSQVTTNHKVPDTHLREATICADACLALVQENPNEFTGQAIIDEDYLRSKGVKDFSKYNCSSEEPTRMLPRKFPSLLVEEEFQDLKAKL